MLVRCHPGGRTLTVRPGESLFAALRRVGVPIAFTCDAEGVCGRCAVQVLEGELTPAGELELRTRTQQQVEGRLSCLCRPASDVTITTSYW